MKNPEIKSVLVKIRRKLVRINGNPNTRLDGWCALSSYVVFHVLKRKGFRPRFCCNDDHAFIVCKRHYIDLTITQFNRPDKKYPRVYCDTKPADKHWHKIENTTTRGRDIWRNTCRGWNRPVKLTHPIIVEMVKSY
jgi:hypothetical protein